jgi:hypothetical protein
MSKPYSPKDEIDKYNLISEKRGFTFFSKENLDAYNKQYGNFTRGDSMNAGRAKAKDFMSAARDINHPKHAATYDTFKTKFDGDEDTVRAYFENKELSANGQAFGQKPIRDSNFERHTIAGEKPKTMTTKDQVHQHETLKAVLAAKWNNEGYQGTDEVINTFNREYAKK